MGRQEGIEVDKCFLGEVGIIIAGILQSGAVAERLPVGVKEPAKFVLTRWGFPKQSPVADLLDVAGLQINLDGETVLEFEQLR